MTRLSTATLPDLGDRVLVPPTPAPRKAGIAHVGVGAFHRAHQAVYVDRLLDAGLGEDWGIVGIGVMPADQTLFEQLRSQDFRYTVMVKRPDGGREARVTRSIVGLVFAAQDPEAALRVLTDPDIRIVTLTITEGGYHLDQATGELLLDGDLEADLVPGAVPRTAFGYLVEALARRRATGVAPFTVASCDNLPGNGELARRAITGFAARRDRGLAAWIASEVAFPSSMVDRITPAATAEDRAALLRDFGVEDACPVVCESHLQWVLEDRFPAGRPRWEGVGVQVVTDVEPFELMKLRVLNAGHQLLGHLGRLLGLQHVDQAASDPDLAALFTQYVRHEAIPTLRPLPGTDLAAYGDDVLRRFANPQISDPLTRICADASDRIPKFVLPVARAQLTQAGPVHRCALVVAAWAHSVERDVDGGIEIVDQRRDELADRARRSRQNPAAFLADRTLFGDLADNVMFRDEFAAALQSLRSHGARATLRQCLDRSTTRGEDLR